MYLHKHSHINVNFIFQGLYPYVTMFSSVNVCGTLCIFHPCLRYYEQDLALAKDLQDKLAQAKAYCNLGLAHKALGEYNKAEECQRYLLSLSQALDNTQVTY